MVKEDSDENNCAVVEQRNKFSVGETIEVMPAKGESFAMRVKNMWNEQGEQILSAPHPQQILKVQFSKPVKQFDMMRKAVSKS